jgi:predicted permease
MFKGQKAEAKLDAELRDHLDRLTQDLIASGVEPDEARRRAKLQFGGIEQIKEECRDVRGRWFEDFLKDLQYAVRVLRRTPGFLAVAVLSLGLGIGANTAIFSLINAVMLRSLPVRNPGALVQLTRIMPNGKPGVVSYPLFEAFRDNLKSVTEVNAQLSGTPAIVIDGQEEVVNSEMVSGNHYSLLGIEPAAGRLFGPQDDALASESPAAVISYRYWQRRFGLSPAAIGKTLTIRDRIFTIVGVTPASFEGTRLGRDPDITLPLELMFPDEQRRQPTFNTLQVMARLKPGTTVEQANAELQILWQSFLQAQVERAAEKDRQAILGQRAAVLVASDGFNALRIDYKEPLLVLMGIVTMVLLLACANLSGLLLARAASRKREISIRLALGATRGRLVRQFLVESCVLSVLGGVLGILLAYWFSGVLVTMLANGGTLLLSTAPDSRVLAFTCSASLLTSLLASVAPGWYALRADLHPGLKELRGRGHQRLGKAFVIMQLSISMVLLVAATLFVGSLVKLYRVDRGLKTDGVLVFGVRSSERYDQAQSWRIQSALLDRLSALPGVDSASASQVVPLGGGLWTRNVRVEGYTFRPDESEEVAFNAVAARYFSTIGMRMLNGREFNEQDTATASPVAIVNESLARYFFGANSPLGRHVTSVKVTYEIVGVTADAKYKDLRAAIPKTMYIPWTQREGDQPSRYSFLVRVTGGDAMRLAPALEHLIREADPALRLRTPQTYSAIIDQSIVTERIMALLGGFFGLLALIVASLGMFGVMAFHVSRRVNELGVRMALGASRGRIVGLVLHEVVTMLVAGCVIGGGAALLLESLATRMLFGLAPTQPGVLLLAAAVLGVAALVAGLLPARRASRIDPIVALRQE